MSTIYKALKKAQKEKDTQHQMYEGVLTGKINKSIGSRRIIWGITAAAVCLFGYAAYSRFHGNAVEKPESPGEPPGVRREVPARVVPDPLPVKKDIAGDSAPENTEMSYNRARAFQKSGDLVNAGRLYREVIEIDSRHIRALNNLGVIYMREGDYGAAQRTLEQAIGADPLAVDPHYNLACVYALTNEPGRAIVHLKQAAAMEPDVGKWATADPDLRNLRGNPQFEDIVGVESRLRND